MVIDEPILVWIQTHHQWAGPLAFALAFAESVALFGLLVPGVMILFALGTLIGWGLLNFWPIVFWTVLGAIVGDGLSFWLGWYYRDRLRSIWPFKNRPEWIRSGIDFFQKYGDKSVIIGRFFGPMRAIIPLVAGMMAMPKHRFITANLISALIWAPAYLLPGILFGASLQITAEIAWRLSALLLLILFSLWLLIWLMQRLFLWLNPPLLLANLLKNHSSWLHRALTDPDHPERFSLYRLARLIFLSSILLILLIFIPAHFLAIADRSLAIIRHSLHHASNDRWMLSLSSMAGIATSLAWWLLSSVILWIRANKPMLRDWLIGTGPIILFSLILEAGLHYMPQWRTFLPDVFVLRAAVLFNLSGLLIHSAWSAKKRISQPILSTLLIGSVLLAQLYWGSSLWAVFWALFIGLIWSSLIGLRVHSHSLSLSKSTSLILLFSLILVLGNALWHRPHWITRFEPVYNLSIEQWLAGGWQNLDRQRSDVLFQSYPLNIQSAVQPQRLFALLQKKGWQIVKKQSWLNILTAQNIDQMPILPHSHRGQLAQWIAFKPINDNQRLVIYLWPSHYRNQSPFWLGELSLQGVKKRLGLNYPVSLLGGDILPKLKRDLDSILSIEQKLSGKLILIH